MTLPTVQTLQRLALPPGTRLVAGAGGLSRGVSWPATLRTRAPAFPSIKVGEFLLISTSSLALLDPNLSLIHLLQRVAQAGISGAAILGEVAEDCVAWADEYDLPVFTLPKGSHLNDLESAIARTIADSRREFDRRAHEIYRQLTQLAIEERGMAAIVEELARISGKPAFLFDKGLIARPQLPSATGDEAPLDFSGAEADVAAWVKRVPISASEPPVQSFDLNDNIALLVAPIMTRDGVSGYLGVVSHRTDLDGLDEAAVAGAAASGAIDLARERAVSDAQDRAQSSIVEEIVAGVTGSTEALWRRAERVHIDLEPDHTVMVVTVSAGELATGVLETCVREAKSVLGVAQGGIVSDRIVLITTVGDRRLWTLADNLKEQLSRRIGPAVVYIGVGRHVPGLNGLRQSYREAIDALRLGTDVNGVGSPAFYSDLGLDRLLLTFREHPELTRFYQETMGKVAVLDAKGDGELLRTLDAYFACNGSPTEASTRLHVHRNTLLYRLQRIRALAEIDLDDPEVRLSLQVALRIRRIMAKAGGGRQVDSTNETRSASAKS